jgi:hypothetical protein
MLLPLYLHLEQKNWKTRIVKLSLILTLSRTVWFGLFIVELIQILAHRKKTIYPPRLGMNLEGVQQERPYSHNLIKLSINLFVLIALMVGAVFLLNQDISFIFDTTLGGRHSEFSDLKPFYWVGRTSFNGLSEIVYLSIYKNFGIFGLITFLVGITSPLWISYLSHRPTKPLLPAKPILTGLLVYLIVSCIDGAILLIPVMAFYWFLSALLLGLNRSPTLH